MSNEPSKTTVSGIISARLKKITESDQWKLGMDKLVKEIDNIVTSTVMNIFQEHPKLMQSSCGWVLSEQSRFQQKKHDSQGDITSRVHQVTSSLPWRQQHHFAIANHLSAGTSNAQTIPQQIIRDQDHNKITSLRPLPRARLPLLQQINLNGNLIEQQHYFEKCCFPKAVKLSLSYPNKKQRIFEESWFVKGNFAAETTIISGKSRLGSFSRKIFLAYMSDLTPKEPKNLFKTFQG